MITVSSQVWGDVWNREHLLEQGMVCLADPDMLVVRGYGLEDVTMGREVARPAAFVVDRKGVVRWRNLPRDWRDRPDGPDYLEALRGVIAEERSP